MQQNEKPVIKKIFYMNNKSIDNMNNVYSFICKIVRYVAKN